MIIKRLILTATRVTFVSVTILAGALCSVSANATTDNVPSVKVKYGDLDPATESGARVLYKRIVIAAERVCVGDSARDLQTQSVVRPLVRACQADAIARAVRVVNSPQLAALHEQHAQHG